MDSIREMAKEQLDGAQVLGPTVNQRRFGPPYRVRAIGRRIHSSVPHVVLCRDLPDAALPTIKLMWRVAAKGATALPSARIPCRTIA